MQSTRSPRIVGTRYSSIWSPVQARRMFDGRATMYCSAYDAAPNSRSTSVTPKLSRPPPPNSAGMFAAYSPAAIERSLICCTRSGGTSPSFSTMSSCGNSSLLGEGTHGVDDHLVLVGEFEVHGAAPAVGDGGIEVGSAGSVAAGMTLPTCGGTGIGRPGDGVRTRRRHRAGSASIGRRSCRRARASARRCAAACRLSPWCISCSRCIRFASTPSTCVVK